MGEGGGHADSEGSTRDLGLGDGVMARVRPRILPGQPSRSTVEWVDPEGTPIPDSVAAGGATGGTTAGETRAIDRAPIPEDYREHVRTYFEGDR